MDYTSQIQVRKTMNILLILVLVLSICASIIAGVFYYKSRTPVDLNDDLNDDPVDDDPVDDPVDDDPSAPSPIEFKNPITIYIPMTYVIEFGSMGR